MAACPPLLDRSVESIDERPRSLCEFAGSVVLIVNTASQCGYTPQYEGLEDLYRKYRSRGLVILGFPSNDFGGQEPGSNNEIASFCVNEYAVDFPMFAKTDLKKNPLYTDLAKATGAAPRWNFHKYLNRPRRPPGPELRDEGRADRPAPRLLDREIPRRPLTLGEVRSDQLKGVGHQAVRAPAQQPPCGDRIVDRPASRP